MGLERASAWSVEFVIQIAGENPGAGMTARKPGDTQSFDHQSADPCSASVKATRSLWGR
jgi:hypothetical protein